MDIIEEGQSPPARAAHDSGQNMSVAPAKPAAPTRPADALHATSGPTIAHLFARLPTTPAAPALQAPTPARDEPATATRRVLLHPAIIPLLSPPLALPDQAIRKRYGHLNVHDAITPLLSPPLACPCLEASKGASYPGLRYYSPWYHSWVGVPSEPNLTHCTAVTPPPILEKAQ